MSLDLKALFADHGREVDAFLRRRVDDPGAAADLTQEAFLRLARLPATQRVEDPRSFLFTIAANLARDHIRRLVSRKKRFADEDEGGDVACAAPLADAVLMAQEKEKLLTAAINALPEKTRAIFLLFHVENRSYREIGTALGISPRTVEYHLRQALAQCRDYVRGSTRGA